MDRNSCLNYFQAFPFWEHMTEEDQDFLLDNIRELHYPAGAAIQSVCAETFERAGIECIQYKFRRKAETDNDQKQDRIL